VSASRGARPAAQPMLRASPNEAVCVALPQAEKNYMQ